MIDAVSLRALGAAGLVDLLGRRPDVAAEPVPVSLGELAGRLAMPSSVVSALRRLDRPALQTAEVIAAYGGTASVGDLARMLGDPAPAVLNTVIDDLVAVALATR